MSKSVYFGSAILVAILAIALYITLLSFKGSQEHSDVKHPNDFGVKSVGDKDPPQRSHVKEEKTTGENEEEKGKLKTNAEENKQDEDKEHSKIPEGHLKYLGDHGSPIILGEIEEVDFVPNGRDFYQHFVRQRKPLVMRGAIKQWPAVNHWANESYLRENYGETVFDIQFTKKYETIHPIKKTMTLNEYLDIYKTENVYLDCPFPQSKMTQDILVPYCLQCDEFNEGIKSIHLLFSNGNTSSSIHYDGAENLLSVIAGTKQVLVANYSYTSHFHMENFTTVTIEAPIDPEAVDLVTYPKLADVTFHKVS